MKKSTRMLLLVGVGVFGALGASWKYQSYKGATGELEKEIENYRTALAERDEKMADKAKINRELKKIAATTLGTEEERVTAGLRKALNEVVSHYKLSDASVTSARPTGLRNPAAEARITEFNDKSRKAAKIPDFYVLPATINGRGTLEQATRVLATLEEQPWVHKIEGFSIKPLGKDRERVELTVSLATIYLADGSLKESTAGEAVSWSPVNEAQYAGWQPLIAKNVFREPAAPTAVAAAPTPAPAPANVASAPPPPPPPPAYDAWKVSGIARGTRGVELMVVNLNTREWLTLLTGGMVLDAKFVDAAGETARISIGDQEFEVKTGQRLSDRKPVTR